MELFELIEQNGLSEGLVFWITSLFEGSAVAKEFIILLTSMLPILECRGGMIAAKLFDLPLLKSFFICYLGNMIPLPFILLLIRQIFAFMKKHNILTKFIEKLEGKTAKNKDKIMRYKQWGLMIFIAIPLPGTGGWTGSLMAALLHIDFKKALPIVALGVFIADFLMALMTYGLGALFNF